MNLLETEKQRLLVIALVAAAVMLPVLINGIPVGYDVPHHYQCAMTFVESIRSGDFYPSWSLNRNFGFGGMETRLYPPVSHYSLAVSYLLIGNWHLATWFTLTFFSFVGCLGVYRWAREYMPARQAVFAGCIYALLPYHLTQVYNTFFFAEFVGSSILPFAFLYVSRVCKRGRAIDVVGLGISYAVLILTHLPLTVIGSISFVVYALAILRRDNFVVGIVRLVLGAGAGLTASSFFWIKVLEEKDLLAKTLVYSDPWLDYRLHFLLTPIQTFTGALATSVYGDATFFYDLMLFCAVLVALAGTIPFFRTSGKQGGAMIGVWIVFGISVFFAIYPSKVVWDRIPLLQEVQFPWRWLAVICITSSVLSASQLNQLVEWFRGRKRPFALIICGCILAVIAFSISQIIRPAPFIPRDAVAGLMEKTSRDSGFTFWWTIWTRKEAFNTREKVVVDNRPVEIQKWTATERLFQVASGDNPSSVRVATLFHPNWKASVNDKATNVGTDTDGAILIPLPADGAKVELQFVEPLSVRLAKIFSGLAWMLLVGFGLSRFLPDRNRPLK